MRKGDTMAVGSAIWDAMSVGGEKANADLATGDASLMQRYCEGDDRAFEMLYRRYRVPLYRFIARLTKHDADEIFQEVWLAVIKGRARYRPSARFSTFLFAIAHRRIADRARRSARRISSGPVPEAIADTAGGPSADFEESRRGTALLVAIAALPLPQRETFLLRAEGELSIDEIAQVMDCSRETTKSRLKYANRALRAKLEPWR